MYVIFYFLLVLAFIYYTFIKPVTYWKRNGVAQQSPFEIWKAHFMNVVQYQPIAETFQNHYNSFPNKRYSGIFQFLTKSLIIRDVDLIKRITIRDFDYFVNHKLVSPGEVLCERNLFYLKGEEWKRMRSTLSPSFTSSKMKMMFNLLLDCTDQLVNYFEKRLETTSCLTLEMKDISTRFANDVIASAAFGFTCDSLKIQDNELFLNGKEIIPQSGFWRHFQLLLTFNLPVLAQICGVRQLSEKASLYFYDVVSRTIRNRAEKKIVRYDMIHLMMEAKNNSTYELTDIDITAQVLLFFFEGFDSVSTLISFMVYELAVNVDVQKRLQEEVDETLKTCEGNITYDALFKMKYLDMVVSETMRKWPSVITIDRVCSKSYEIPAEREGEVSVHLKEGDIVWIPIYGLHRDPELFPNPERFDPDRFSEKNRSSLNIDAYIPFGSGPRSCIANRFALMEAKLLFLKLLSKFDIVVVEETPIPLQLAKSAFQLTAENGFWVGFRSRI